LHLVWRLAKRLSDAVDPIFCARKPLRRNGIRLGWEALRNNAVDQRLHGIINGDSSAANRGKSLGEDLVGGCRLLRERRYLFAEGVLHAWRHIDVGPV